MAQWALLLLVVSSVGTLIAGFGVLFVARTLRLQYIANDDARKRFEEEHRAWLDVSFTVDEYMRHNETLWFRVNLTARNVGHSPATNVFFEIPRTAVLPFTGSELKQFKRQIADHKLSEHVTGETVFQSGDRLRSGIVRTEVGRPNISGLDFTVPVFVSYRIASDKLRHVTPVVIWIRITDEDFLRVDGHAEHHPLSLDPD